MTKLTPQQITDRLNQGYDPDRDGADEWDEAFYELIDKGDERVTKDSLLAYAHLLTEGGASDPVSADEFAASFEDSYRYAWDSHGAFARHFFTEDWASMGDHPSVRTEVLEKFEEYIDWEEVGSGHEMSDYTFVTLPGADALAQLHVFRD